MKLVKKIESYGRIGRMALEYVRLLGVTFKNMHKFARRGMPDFYSKIIYRRN